MSKLISLGKYKESDDDVGQNGEYMSNLIGGKFNMHEARRSWDIILYYERVYK